MIVDGVELWKPIKDYEGLYEISNYGRVKSLERYTNSKNEAGCILQKHNERILKNNITKSGYVMATLYKNGVPKSYFIHRLVAKAFIPNHNLLREVNHIDENKQNNRVDNLEWCSREYNNRYSKAKKIIQYDMSGKYIRSWESSYQASRENKLYSSNIRNCCLGKLNSTGGYRWKYAE